MPTSSIVLFDKACEATSYAPATPDVGALRLVLAEMAPRLDRAIAAADALEATLTAWEAASALLRLLSRKEAHALASTMHQVRAFCSGNWRTESRKSELLRNLNDPQFSSATHISFVLQAVFKTKAQLVVLREHIDDVQFGEDKEYAFVKGKSMEPARIMLEHCLTLLSPQSLEKANHGVARLA